MFGVSGGELVLLLLIGLVVLGPERLPRVANKLGSWLGQARRMTRVMKRQLEDELDLNKTLNTRPPASKTASLPSYKPPRDDDTFSPAHGEEDVGTGVGDAIYDDESDLAVTEAERETLAASGEPAETEAKRETIAASDDVVSEAPAANEAQESERPKEKPATSS